LIEKSDRITGPLRPSPYEKNVSLFLTRAGLEVQGGTEGFVRWQQTWVKASFMKREAFVGEGPGEARDALAA
jgi:hypothetical protein